MSADPAEQLRFRTRTWRHVRKAQARAPESYPLPKYGDGDALIDDEAADEIVRLREELAEMTQHRDYLRETVELLEWRAAP